MAPRNKRAAAASSSKASKQPLISGLARWCIRCWLALFGKPVRVLGSERLPGSAAILQLRHATRFADALLLTAASERPVTFVLARRNLRGLELLLASTLGMICCEEKAARWHSALRTCTEVLASGGLVAAFQQASLNEAGTGRHAPPLRLAQEAWSSAFPEVAPVLLPVHRFRPPGRHQEILIHIGEPVGADELRLDARLRHGSGPGDREGVFAMDGLILNRLLRDFEQALRDQLREEWAARAGGRQTEDGFRLSPRAAETLRSLNRAEPETLLELRQLLEAERDHRRQYSLVRLRAQLGRGQLSAVSRILTWAETVFGLPVAFYGAVNHAVVGLLLAGLNLVQREKRAQAGTWGIRVLIVVLCYAAQIALVNHLLGRAAAGYYAVTLPVSGAYVWRYRWLLRRRTYLLLLGARAAVLQRAAKRNRQRFLARLGSILDKGAASSQAAETP